MKKIKLFIFAICAVVISSIIISCKKDKDTKPIITVSPGSLHLNGNVGDLVIFNISVSSDVALSKVVIKGQPDNETPVILLDTAISTKSTSFTYYYRIPSNLAGKSILFIFRAETQSGISNENFTRLYITAPPVSQAKLLTETTGHRMYSAFSINADAYNLELNSSEYSLTADTASRDIQDRSTSDNLSANWKSPAGGKFVLYAAGSTAFDYANATDSTAINSYNSGVKSDLLNGLQVNDIIITKLGSVTSSKYAVIRISGIVDNPGNTTDYYEFNIKK